MTAPRLTGITYTKAARLSQARAIRPKASVWVSASAGSGKTMVLTRRVLALLLTGTPANRILCLTFTKAAAAEMANRIAAQLSGWVTADENALMEDLAQLLPDGLDRATLKRARRLFAEVLDAPGGLQISTLHAFCQSLLRRFPLEADVAPHFALIEERDADEALARALEATLAEARDGSDRELAKAMKVITDRVHETSFSDLMTEVLAARGRIARLLAATPNGVDGVTAKMAAYLRVPAGATPDDIVTAASGDSAFARVDLRRAADALQAGSETDQERAAVIARWLASDVTTRVIMFAAYASAFLTAKDQPRKTLITKAAAKTAPDAIDILSREAARLETLQATRKSAAILQASAALLRIGGCVLARYRKEKADRNWLDYDDLIQTTRRLLERPGQAAWVLYKLDGGLDHVLVDEAQDTNPDQWAILRALTTEFFAGEGRHEDKSPRPRTVFAVGDRKQSIYSFQGAAPREFDAMRHHMESQVKAAGRDWEMVPLNVSFRSVTAVLDAVDAVFAFDNARRGVADTDETIAHLPSREGHGGLVEIWPTVEPAAQDDPPPWKPPVERVAGDVPEFRLAGLIAKRIKLMVDTGEKLISKDRQIRPGDIMVLVRRRTGFVEELVRRLKQANIAVAGVDRMVLTEQLAVMDMMALGRFLLLPADDLTLATVLKSPLVGLSEEELFALAHGRGDRTLWEVLRDHAGADSRFGVAHGWLADLLARADFLTPTELFAHVLVTSDGRRKLLARLGEEADDPLDEFLRLTLAYQETHPPSLEGLLHWLERGETSIKRDLDQTGADAVRVVTVHGAKGLQAPIVFLPDTTQPPTTRGRLLWTDDETPLMLWAPRSDDMDNACRTLRDAADAARDEEYRRLLYVAMTRAEDRLYVCGWHTRRPASADKTWYGMIREGLTERAQIITDHALAADKDFPEGDVLRLENAQTASPDKISAAPVVAEVMPLPTWARQAAPEEETPPRPLAPSQAVRTDPPALSPLADGAQRFQRGLIIHRLLQSLPEIPLERRRDAAQAFVSRPTWRLPREVQLAVVDETLAVLDAPEFTPLFAPGSRAEVPISGLVHGHAVAGQVDRLAVTADTVWIVDYKTNRPPPRQAENVDPAYVFQMAVYRAALTAIYPRHAIRCVLLWTDGPFTLELPAAQMEVTFAKLDGSL
ncbi:MAG: double-strand break repair helicase AddA [Rhodospirillaceae bacterium]|nr:MAG: double-strand break repair helicase AddA [Rhodospirillaceae bacterium]